MTAQLIDGAGLAREKLIQLKHVVTSLQARGIQPGLATVQVGGAEVALGALDDQSARVVVGEGGAVHTTTE